MPQPPDVEIQARAVIAAALIQSKTINLDAVHWPSANEENAPNLVALHAAVKAVMRTVVLKP